jgi:hypothetical protein
MDNNPDSAASKAKKQSKGRDALRIQRQNGIGGGGIGAGLSIPKG